jgi:mono/diheme cytochrome c family protein
MSVWMFRVQVRQAALSVALMSGVMGCGGETPQTPVDGGDDLGGDVASDASIDATADVSSDRGADASGDVEIPAPPIVVGSVPWNASGADVGMVAALAEQGDALVLFGSRGMQLIEGGVVSATDARVTTWRTAAVIPAGDGTPGDWVVGVDSMGRVWRLSNRTTLEEVTGRYALMMRDAQSVARLSMNRVAFGLRTGLAVADGMRVRVWMDPSFVNLVGAGSRVAAPTSMGLRVFDLDADRFIDFTLAGVTGVAFDAMGKLVVTTANALYTENDRGELVFRRRSAAALRGLVQSGARTWLAAGTSLATWDGTDIRLATDARVAATARLLPSQSGDVWALDGGRLSRFSIVDSPDLQLWIETVRPVFARRCTPCHLPEGTGNRDLTTYASWVAGRGDISGRVLTAMDMPPPPGMLTAAERAAVTRWLNAMPTDGGVGDGGRADVPLDRPAEAGVDAGVDAAMDAARDVAADAPREAGVDAAADAPRDAAADAPRDAAADAPRDAAAVTYAAVDAIFQTACVRCHGASGGLNLATPAAAYTALVGAPAAGTACAGGGRVRVVAGNPMGSLLYLKLVNMQTCGNSMPRSGPLTPAQIDTVRQWIQGGALR